MTARRRTYRLPLLLTVWRLTINLRLKSDCMTIRRYSIPVILYWYMYRYGTGTVSLSAAVLLSAVIML